MPLVNLLVPQLLRKAQDLEAQIGPPGAMPTQPLMTGYLQAGYEKTPYDPKGLIDKPGTKNFDGSDARNKELVAMGRLQRSENPYTQDFARAYLNSRGGSHPTPEPMPTSPAAPMKIVQKGEKVGTKGRVLQLDPNAAVGVDERTGQDTTVKGKKLGYLAQPELVTPSGSTALRNPDRKGKDVMKPDTDKFSDFEIDRRFGKHLKAMQENRDANGMPTDRFPDGYFNGASDEEKKAVIDGVMELRRRQKLAEEGISI